MVPFRRGGFETRPYEAFLSAHLSQLAQPLQLLLPVAFARITPNATAPIITIKPIVIHTVKNPPNCYLLFVNC
jgi:hypothetical protein